MSSITRATAIYNMTEKIYNRFKKNKPRENIA